MARLASSWAWLSAPSPRHPRNLYARLGVPLLSCFSPSLPHVHHYSIRETWHKAVRHAASCAPSRRHGRPLGRTRRAASARHPARGGPATAGREGRSRGGKLVDGCSGCCGCWRAAISDVRQTARRTMSAWRPWRPLPGAPARPPSRTSLAVSGRRPARGAVGGGPAPAGRDRPSARGQPCAGRPPRPARCRAAGGAGRSFTWLTSAGPGVAAVLASGQAAG
jgi:hypothetical protein